MFYLPFTGDNGSGGGGGGGTTIISGSVSTYADLPPAISYTGLYYIVDTNTGTWILGTLKKAGLYKSNGTTWVYIDNVPETTSLSDGTTVITGTNIILTGTNGITTLTDVANNKITISAPSALSNLSGSNTGDETSTTIKSKLGISTLSGSNTGDQDLSALATTSALTSHTSNTSNPHSVTKTQVGLGNVPNTDCTTTANITDSTDKRYVTDAQKTVLTNTSGTNTGDETATTIKTKLSSLTGENRLDASAIKNITATSKLDIATRNNLLDSFTTDNGSWTAPSAYTDNTATISGGVLTLSAPTVYNKSFYQNTLSKGKNSIVSVDIVGSVNNPAIWLRTSAGASTYETLMLYVSSSQSLLKTLYFTNGTVTALGNVAIPNYSSASSYRLIAKCFEDYITFDLVSLGQVVCSVDQFITQTLAGVMNGLGVGGAGSCVYDTFLQRRIDKLLNIICLGDSLTQGTTVAGTYGEGVRYPQKLKYATRSDAVMLTNKGVGGNTIANIDARVVSDVFAYKSIYAEQNLVILIAGTNDISSSTAPATVLASWEALITRLKNSGFKVWACTIPPRSDNSTFNTNTVSLNNLYRASTVPDKLLDWHSLCVQGDGSTPISGYMMSDGVHVVPAVNDLLVNLITTEINNQFIT